MSPKPRGPGTIAWLLLSVLLLAALYFHSARYVGTPPQAEMPAGHQPLVPVDKQRLSRSQAAPKPLPPLDTSLDSIHRFDKPPLFNTPEEPVESEMARQLKKNKDKRVTIGGKVYFTDDTDPARPEIEGGRIDVEINTQ